MKKLNVGIIGLGVGEKHIEGYQHHPQAKVSKICDINPHKLQEVHQKFSTLEATTDPQKILCDPEIDVVSICSYDDCHYHQIITAINNNKHIFVEKPVCIYEKEARDIYQHLQSKPHLKISSNLILRMSPRFRKIKAMLKNKEFGDIFFIEGAYNYGRLQKITEGWRGQQDLYSIIYGGGVHIVDLILWLTGEKIEEVMTYGNRIVAKDTNFKYNDFTISILKFYSGLIAKVTCNFGCVHPHFHEFSVFGTKATFINRPSDADLFVSRDPKTKPTKIAESYREKHKGDLIYSFINAIFKEEKAEVGKVAIFDSMAVCFAMEKSSCIQAPVKVSYIQESI